MPFKPATIRLLASPSWLMILGLCAMSSPLQAADTQSAVSPATQSVPAPHRSIGGVTILTDTQGVNFGPYVKEMLHSIGERWHTLLPEKAHAPTLAKGVTDIRFKVDSNGKVSGMLLDASSHDDQLNRAAWDALKGQQFPPLPSSFTAPYLEMRIQFCVNANTSEKGLSAIPSLNN